MYSRAGKRLRAVLYWQGSKRTEARRVSESKKRRVVFNAPATLGFVIACFVIFLIDLLTNSSLRMRFFSVYRSSWSDPLTYFRFIGHVFGHGGWDHLVGNMLYILLLGPMLEEKHGSSTVLFLMGVTALVTGLFAFLTMPGTISYGASGIVFAMILMSSFTEFRQGTVPLTFILVAVLYLGQQIYNMVTVGGNIGYAAHIIGGAVGAVLGWILNKQQGKKRY